MTVKLKPDKPGSGGAGAKIVDGARMTTTEALAAAEEFLGTGYKEIAPGVFRSADGRRQVRMTESDIAGHRGGESHMNFETGSSIIDPNGRVTFKPNENSHVYLTD
jgi:hypothetical protein